jgi:dTDP-D-glucose 4,6-dehydratase
MKYITYQEITTIRISTYFNKYLDLSYSRVGQDVRYSVDDTKLKQTGWKPVKQFDEELSEIVNFYKNNYIW